MQLTASPVPPKLTIDLEAAIESQKTKIPSLSKEICTSTQDSLNCGDEVNLTLIQRVCVDGSGWYIDIISKPNCRTKNRSPTTSWE